MKALFGILTVGRSPSFPWALVLTLSLLPAARGFDAAIDSPMYSDPDIPVPPIITVFPEEKGLWLKALARPEVEMRAEAAAAIARGYRRGVKGLEATVAPLRAALDRPDQHPAVVLAVAQALVALDAREAAPGLSRVAQDGGSDVRELVEPALARWDYRPARAVWLARLQEPGVARRDLVLAIRGLGEVGEDQAAEPLRRMVLAERVPGPVRLECARALGQLHADGLEKDAERLAADASPRGTVARLAAASLLLHRKGEPAVRLLQRLTADPEPAVVALAAGRLLEIDPQLLLPALDRLLGSLDANVRSLGVAVLLRRPTAERLRPLADRLDDVHSGVRLQARGGLRDLAGRKEFHDPVIAEATRLLAAPSWRGQEQAAILLAQLDHRPATGRLLELLASDRPEVFVTAAWALRRLDVPETLPAVTRYVEATWGPLARGSGRGRPTLILDHQLSQLNQFLGRRKYAPAEPLLRRFIPKPGGMPADPEARAAAVWALGRIHEGRQVTDLAAALVARLNDSHSMPPESTQVRWLSAVTLGRLRDKEALPSLRKNYAGAGPSEDRVSNVCGWAIEQLTGEKMPPAQPIKRVQRDVFLTPAD